MKKLIITFIFSIVGLTMSCHKQSAEPCLNGECCWPGYKNTVLRQVEGSRAGFLGSAFIFEDQVFGPELNTAIACPAQTRDLQAMNLENNLSIDSRTGNVHLIDSARVYPYKIWGTVYLIDIPDALVATYGFRVDRVEKVQ